MIRLISWWLQPSPSLFRLLGFSGSFHLTPHQQLAAVTDAATRVGDAHTRAQHTKESQGGKVHVSSGQSASFSVV